MLGNFSDEAVCRCWGCEPDYERCYYGIYHACKRCSVVINQHLGARHDEQAGQISMNASALVSCLAVVISAFFIACSPFVMMLMGLEGNLIADASTYLQWVGGASVMISVLQRYFCALSLLRKRQSSDAIVLFINIVNVIGNYLVIFRPFEIPLYGISESASSALPAKRSDCSFPFCSLQPHASVTNLNTYGALNCIPSGRLSALVLCQARKEFPIHWGRSSPQGS